MATFSINGVDYAFTATQIEKSGLFKDLTEVFGGDAPIAVSTPDDPHPAFDDFGEYYRFITTSRGNYPRVITMAHYLLDPETTRRAAWKFYCGRTEKYHEWFNSLTNEWLMNELPVGKYTNFSHVFKTMPEDLLNQSHWKRLKQLWEAPNSASWSDELAVTFLVKYSQDYNLTTMYKVAVGYEWDDAIREFAKTRKTLYIASVIGDLLMAKRMLPLAVNNGESLGPAFKAACRCGHADVVAEFLKFGATPERIHVKIAAEHNRPEVLRVLTGLGSYEPNDDASVQAEAFIQSCRFGWLEIVREILENGVNPNTDEHAGLRACCENGWLDVVRVLHKHNANYRSDNDSCCLLARRNGHVDVVEFLESLMGKN